MATAPKTTAPKASPPAIPPWRLGADLRIHAGLGRGNPRVASCAGSWRRLRRRVRVRTCWARCRPGTGGASVGHQLGDGQAAGVALCRGASTRRAARWRRVGGGSSGSDSRGSPGVHAGLGFGLAQCLVRQRLPQLADGSELRRRLLRVVELDELRSERLAGVVEAPGGEHDVCVVVALVAAFVRTVHGPCGGRLVPIGERLGEAPGERRSGGLVQLGR